MFITTQYEAKLKHEDKHGLLCKMVEFQEQKSKTGSWNLDQLLYGKVLFKLLEATANTEALQMLSRSYWQHLDAELETLKRLA